MESPNGKRSLGHRFLVTVIVGAVLPLGLVGLWTTRNAERSARTLLRSQLEAALAQTKRDVQARWASRRSDLLYLAENEPVREILSDTSGPPRTPEFASRAWEGMTGFNRVVIRDRAAHQRLTFETVDFVGARGDPSRVADAREIPVRLPVMDLMAGDTIGSVEASVRAAVLLPGISSKPAPNTPVMAVLLTNGTSIVPPTVDQRMLTDESIEWNGHHWLSVSSRLTEPTVELAIAGPLDTYLAPFERTAQSAAVTLLFATTAVVIGVTLVTLRMTREVERELAQREALAAVGEFSSELSHEVRNPLTAVRLDLQRIDEVATDADAVRRISARVLEQVDRIDRAVTGALRIARGGSIERRRVDLRAVLDAASRAVEAEFALRGGSLTIDTDSSPTLELEADASALEQLFVNLFINAAHALAPGGAARVTCARQNGTINVIIADNGVGMSAEQLKRLGEPFRSTKGNGAGLGLKIALRIIRSHRGEIDVQSTLGAGTSVRVRLPG